MKIILPAAALAFLAGGAQAHHSQTMFDVRNPVELRGTVREFQWTNPHCYIQLMVADDSGRTVEWSVEMGAPMHLQGRGWTPRTIRPGDEIKVTLLPLRNGRPGGELASVARPDGSPIGRVS